MTLKSRLEVTSFASHMRVMNHNWSATKQRLHPQSVAEISRHSVLSGDRIRQCETSSGFHHKDTVCSRHFLLQAPQCPCFVQKRFRRDHCCRGRSKPGCQILGSHTRSELITFQLCLHRLLMSTGCKSSHNGFLDVSRSNGGLRISCWIGQLSCLTIFPPAYQWQPSFVRLAVQFGGHWKPWERCRTEGTRDETHGRIHSRSFILAPFESFVWYGKTSRLVWKN